MSAEIRRLNEERGTVVKEMRDLLDKTKTEKRSLTAEEQQKYDVLFDKQDQLKRSIETETKQAEVEHELRVGKSGSGDPSFKPGNGGGNDGDKEKGELQTRAFRNFLKHGVQALSQDEIRALSAGSLPEGGALVPPTQWVQDMLKAVDNLVVIRAEATKFQVPSAVSLGVPTLESDPDDADWTTELGTGSEDSAMKFGMRELLPAPFAKRIKISNKLIRSATIPVEQLVLQRLAYKFAITEEKALMIGHGVNQPLGLFTAHANGIPTSRDVVTGSGTAILADSLFDMKYSLKQQYIAKAKWLYHRDAMKQIAKLKDSQNQYLWQPGLQLGQPDRLLNHPILQSEYVPNTFTSGKYVGLFGDFSFVWIADALDMTVQKLSELYAETNQTGYIGRKEMDGQPVMAEAFARLKTS